MQRLEFVRLCGIFSIGLPFQLSMVSCQKDDDFIIPSNFKVIIIGAGAGGLSAGYFLKQQGIDFEILEASANYGGRMKINTDFADFPIPLGAEWLETGQEIFQEIVNDSSVEVDVKTCEDDPDRKFKNYSWFNFFEEYIVPAVENKISYNTIVESIDYSATKVVVKTRDQEFSADRLIVSVPVKILKENDIQFTPSLPQSKLDALSEIVIWEGFKAFIEFSDKFYNDEYEFEISPTTDGQKIYYNASQGQNTAKNILGLFVVGKPAQDYISKSGDELKNFILSELDGLYANQASAKYQNHVTQNWNDEPFIKAGYMSDHVNWRTVRELGKSIDQKVYFAGGAYTEGDDWVSVHTAAQSAKRAIDELVSEVMPSS
jgi:monoamine oxidase